DIPRPVLLEQPRQRAVREQAAPGLAAGTVIRLVVCVTNALHLGAAHRTGQTEAAVHAHVRPEGRDLLRKLSAAAGAPPPDPAVKLCSRRLIELLHRSIVDPARQRQWREARRMQYLVGISIADAAEKPRVGERALEGMTLAAQLSRELCQARLEDLDAPGV